MRIREVLNCRRYIISQARRVPEAIPIVAGVIAYT